MILVLFRLGIALRTLCIVLQVRPPSASFAVLPKVLDYNYRKLGLGGGADSVRTDDEKGKACRFSGKTGEIDKAARLNDSAGGGQRQTNRSNSDPYQVQQSGYANRTASIGCQQIPLEALL